MELELYNTLTKKKERFKPLGGKTVKMYHCGPTVYNYAHIGNLRAYVFADILRRTLEYVGYETKQVINITDVGHLSSDADEGEDKMTRALKREGKPFSLEAMYDVGTFYKDAFLEDLKKLNIKTPHELPRASEHIKEQIELIKTLEQKGFIYTLEDGVYFDISKFPKYGELSGQGMENQLAGARVEVNRKKKHPADFALWKFNKDLGWNSLWGKGFPGWHIECSAMSIKYLGESFDIHTGGIDHIAVHHTNEITQSEAATGRRLARFWMHSAFLNMKERKMAKSEDNFLRLATLEDRRISPLAYRYYLLTVHYRSPITFSWEALEAASQALSRLAKHFSEMQQQAHSAANVGNPISHICATKFEECIGDDLNTPKAIALIWNMIKNESLGLEEKYATILEFDKILGLGFNERPQELANLASEAALEEDEIPEEVAELVREREQARAKKDFTLADKLREKIQKKSYTVHDSESGPRIIKIK